MGEINSDDSLIDGHPISSGDHIEKIHIEGITGGAVAIGREARATLNQYTNIIIKADNFEDQPPAPGEPPYKGLGYFTEADKNLFFGREGLSERVTERLHSTHFLALIGASGSGKSSLLRAGVIPRLRAKNWQIRVMKPGHHPITALANCLTQDNPALTAASDLQQLLYSNADTLHLAGAKIAARYEAERLLLAVDQFEELFTQCQDTAERSAFVQNLVVAVEAHGATTMLVGMRADFYDRVAEFDRLRLLLSQQQEFIGPMSQGELVRAIIEPARLGGWQFVEGLVEQIVEDVGQEPGRLPLLSQALLETWERRRGVVMTLGGYRDTDGVEGAIAHTADAVLAKLTPDQVLVAREIFLKLTELGEGAEDTRRVVGRDALSTVVGEAALDGMLETLVAARLVTVGDGEVEVAHEALIRRWPRLREWLADNRERLRFERQIGRDAALWERLGEDVDVLYRGGRLFQVEERLAGRELTLDDVSLRFIKAGQELRRLTVEQEEIQRQRELAQARRIARFRKNLVYLLGAVIVLLVFLIVSQSLPIVRRMNARNQAKGELVKIEEHVDYLLGTERPDRARNELPVQMVTLPAFWLEKYEVTNRRYSYCVDFGNCSPPNYLEDFRDEEKAEHPVTGVTAIEAAIFCEWIGRQLPNELQWERAARGPASDPWPWGTEELTSEYAVIGADFGSTRSVGSRPEGRSGEMVFDLIGNVWEWTVSYDEPDYDMENVWSGDWRDFGADVALVRRGMSFSVNIDLATVTWRAPLLGTAESDDTGFRCVEN